MLRTHTCGELRLEDQGADIVLSGWVQKTRNLGGMTFIDLRDRYGITQIVFNMDVNPELCEQARKIGREYVLAIRGIVQERSNKNPQMPTGDIEINATGLVIQNTSKTPPFTIENETDGGEDIRMKFRYLDLRRDVMKSNLELRHRVTSETRRYLDDLKFIEVETPYLIKSTPEGARDFVVPSRLNPGEFYALPQSPQTFKQLLMVAGYDRYYQIVKCFRDEDLRADRQPEFTQIDCEMAFVTQEDVLETFEGLARHIFSAAKNINLGDIPRIKYEDAMKFFGSDKPDIRFGMIFEELNDLVKGKDFVVFDQAELVAGINAKGCAEYTRKQIDELTEWVKRPQIGAKGLVYLRYNSDGTLKSSVDKFYPEAELRAIAGRFNAEPGDLILILAGEKDKTRKQLGELRLEMGNKMGLRKKDEFKACWVLDFPLFEWDEETKRWNSLHHPFTAPKKATIEQLAEDPGTVVANAYDFTINGVEIAGGSIRIHNRQMQEKIFDLLGMSKEEAKEKFGFLMGAFEYGAPPHGGIAFGLDRLCMLMGGGDSIRDFIAFPKNNAGRDLMLDAPSAIDQQQLDELNLSTKKK